MLKTTIPIITILCVTAFNCFGQFKAKTLKKIPSEYSDLLVVMENSKGLLMSFNHFKKGRFVEANESEIRTLMTTMLLGSATFLYDHLKQTETTFKPVVIKPNGFTTTEFQIKFNYEKGSIYILRKMVYRSVLANARAAENPNNYGLVYGFNIRDHEEKQRITDLLLKYCDEHHMQYKWKEVPRKN